MAYEKTEWKNGDTITAEKLNHMEDGIAEGGGSGGELLVVNAVPESEGSSAYNFDKTFGEIWEVYKSGRPIVINMEHQHGILESIYYTFVPEGEYPGYAQGDVKFCNTIWFSVSLSEGPYTEERLLAEYPYASFD